MSQKIYTNLDIKGNATIGDITNATSDTDKFLVSDAGVVKYRTGSEMLSDLGVAPGVASNVQHQVKAGVAINKGQAVYVTSADGTNMIVELASNTAEVTSSKTMGLLGSTVPINGFANVIAEGLLDGLNTSSANAGDPVWLGTGGNLIYGLANKPYAPAHLVFIGIVTRVNANNGEIFVKVQNGFELDELHDVDLKSSAPVGNQILAFEGAPVNLWKNKTIPSVLGYTPVPTTITITINGSTQDLSANRIFSIDTGVTSFNTRTGAITLSSVDVTGALGYTPYNASNPAGYISSYTETDPTVPSHVKAITTTNISNWNTAFSWGNHSGLYMTQGQTRTDINSINNGGNRYDPSVNNPTNEHYAVLTYGNGGNVTGQLATHFVNGNLYSRGYNSTWSSWRRYWNDTDFTNSNISNWNTAFGWGNHASAGYVPGARTITINGTTQDLSANRSFTVTAVEVDTLASVTARGSATSSSITAERYRGNNSLILNSYTTVNPSSNVFLYSQPNDRDAWLYLDSADTGSNWGIYHRQIDSTVSGLPGNSLGFIGGGSSALQAWVSLANGSGYFAGNLTSGSSISAPIFYDSNNTGFYGDFASTSNFNALLLNSEKSINTTTPGLTSYGLTFMGGTSDFANGMIWTWGNTNAQAGIYVQSSGAYGTKMYLATTDSFATGSKTAMTIDHLGNVSLNRGRFSNGSVWINNGTDFNAYNENIRLFNAPNGVSVIAFGASGTGGTPQSSILGFSDRYEVRVGSGDQWQQRSYNGYTEINGSSRAPMFYDSNDTGYYVDPAGFSTMGRIHFRSSVNDSNSGGIIGRNHAYDTLELRGYGSEMMIGSQGADLHINYRTCNSGTANHTPSTWYWRAGSASSFSNHYWGLGEASLSLRAPIFYDSNNTGYYIDPASTSNLNIINSQGYRLLTRLDITVVGGNWYTIATNPGNRAHATFDVWDIESGMHGEMKFVAGISYGGTGQITVLNKSWHSSGGIFDNIRIRKTGTYDTHYLQIYATTSGTLKIGMTDNFQESGWTLVDGGAGTPGSYTAAEVVPDSYGPGLITSGDMGISKGSPLLNFYSTATGRSGYIGLSGDYDMRISNSSGGNLYLGSGNSVLVETSFQTPIMYDYSNTGYYVDPASNSNLNTGTFQGRLKYSDYIVSNNQGGMMGDYNISGTAAKCIWTIGESWPLANMYGLAYEYNGSYYHHLALKENGTTYARLSFGSAGAYFTGTLTSGADVVAYSDRRLKDNIQTIENALDKVVSLRGVTYTRNDKEDKSQKVGVIAQEVQEILPQVVFEQEDGILGVSYGNITAVLIEAIKEQQTQIEELKQLVNKLINK